MNDEQKILSLVSRYCECVHTQNEADFRALWTDTDANILISGQKKFNGLNSIYQDFLIDLIQQTYQSIDLIAETTEVHLLDETHATVVFQYHTECIRRDNGEPFGIQGLETQLALKQNGEWKLSHIHYSAAPRT